jgi:hypothetical protein
MRWNHKPKCNALWGLKHAVCNALRGLKHAVCFNCALIRGPRMTSMQSAFLHLALDCRLSQGACRWNVLVAVKPHFQTGMRWAPGQGGLRALWPGLLQALPTASSCGSAKKKSRRAMPGIGMQQCSMASCTSKSSTHCSFFHLPAPSFAIAHDLVLHSSRHF